MTSLFRFRGKKPVTPKNPVAQKSDFVKSLENVAKDVSRPEYSFFTPSGFDPKGSVGVALRYFDFAEALRDLLEEEHFFLNNAEMAGLTTHALLVAGMTMAARNAGAGELSEFQEAVTDPSTTKIAFDLTGGGTPTGERKDLYLSRNSQIECALGLSATENEVKKNELGETFFVDVQPMANRLSEAFSYVDELSDSPHFRISDAGRDRLYRVEKKLDGPERVCPMRSKTEELFCIVAKAACSNPTLVPYDLSLPAIPVDV